MRYLFAQGVWVRIGELDGVFIIYTVYIYIYIMNPLIYPLSILERKAMENYVKEALQQGFIHPSTSPAASSFFFVGKKDGGLRPCIDYRALNEHTVKLPYNECSTQRSDLIIISLSGITWRNRTNWDRLNPEELWQRLQDASRERKPFFIWWKY